MGGGGFRSEPRGGGAVKQNEIPRIFISGKSLFQIGGIPISKSTCEGGFANRDPNLDFQVANRDPNLDLQVANRGP